MHVEGAARDADPLRNLIVLLQPLQGSRGGVGLGCSIVFFFLIFIIRNIPQRCVAGITFVLTFIETSFNPAL